MREHILKYLRDTIAPIIAKHKNWYHLLLSLLILVGLTSILVLLKYSEKDGIVPTSAAVAFLAIFPSRFCEWIQPRLKLGTDTWNGFFKNYSLSFIFFVVCWIFGADNIFQLILLIFK